MLTGLALYRFFDRHNPRATKRVLSIILTAPLGAWAINLTGQRLLKIDLPAVDS